MPWVLAGGGVVVVAVVGVLIFVLTGGGGSGSAQGVAEDAVDAINNKDVDKLNELACEEAKEAAGTFDPTDLQPQRGIEVKAELGEVKESGDTATAQIKLSISGDLPAGVPEGTGDATVPMRLAKKDGNWCIAGVA